MTTTWAVTASAAARNTVNPLRAITDRKNEVNPDKEVINLSIGDPTAHGNLKTHDFVLDSLHKVSISHKYSGYPPSSGYEAARAAVAQFFTTPVAPLTSADVVLASGGSGALDLVITALLNPGDNMLIPLPAFSLYECICASKGFDVKRYRLLPERNWEADIDHMRSLIDSKTRAILVNNPSNPCGSVYTKEHLQQILAVAEEFKLPIISDEIYAGMAFTGSTFFPLATLTTAVPVLTVGGLAKRFLVPGWRLGWILIHDRNEVLKEVKPGLIALTQLILGPNSLVQSMLPDILHNTPQEFFDSTNKTLEEHANFGYDRIGRINGLKPIRAQGAMYQMVEVEIEKFKDITDDVDFFRKLLAEESVFVLPGKIFTMPNFFRLVTCAPIPKLEIAYTRMEEFCKRHAKN
jgi:tyrosine aminotransferase